MKNTTVVRRLFLKFFVFAWMLMIFLWLSWSSAKRSLAECKQNYTLAKGPGNSRNSRLICGLVWIWDPKNVKKQWCYYVFVQKSWKSNGFIVFSLTNGEKASVLLCFRSSMLKKALVLLCFRSNMLKQHWFHCVFARTCWKKHWFACVFAQTCWKGICFTVFSLNNVEHTLCFKGK